MNNTLRILGFALALPLAAASAVTAVTAVAATSADHATTSKAAGSQSTGAGAGRVTFNPFSITRSLEIVGDLAISPHGLV
jgi:hypothetical protein